MGKCADKLIKIFGGPSEAARRVSQTRQTVWAWQDRGLIPVRHASVVELATEGRITRLDILTEHELAEKLKAKRS